MTKKFNAFTLAEVLITLGIIGVVAAMTMPTLINQTNGAQYKAAYKKALSAISQAITLNVALDDKSFADATVASTTNSSGDDSVVGFLRQRMNIVKVSDGSEYNGEFPGQITASVCTITTGSGEDATTSIVSCSTEGATAKAPQTVSPDIFMFFNDSSMFAILGQESEANGGCTKNSPCSGVIDVNGVKGPNALVSDATNPTDIYRVVYYDQTIKPVQEPETTVLYGK